MSNRLVDEWKHAMNAKASNKVDREVYLRLCVAAIAHLPVGASAQEYQNVINRCWYAAKDFERWANTNFDER